MVFTDKALAVKNALNLARQIIAAQGNDNLEKECYKTLAECARKIAEGGTTEQKKEYISLLWATTARQTAQ